MATNTLSSNQYVGQVMPIFGGMLGITAITTYLVGASSAPYFWPLAIATFVMIFILNACKESAFAVPLVMLFAAMEGALIGPLVASYSPTIVTQALGTTALTFIGMAAYGATTKRDLSGWGLFLMTALWGLLVAVIVGLFVQAALLHIIISAAVIVLFAAFTAFDMQNIVKGNYDPIMGAVSLYLDLINLFLHMLRILGWVNMGDD